MPIIKSAKKRVKVAAKANLRNVKTKRTMRDALKAYYAAVARGNAAEIAKLQKEAVSALDIAAKKAVIHKNKAARKKTQLAAMAKAKGVKIVASPKSRVASSKLKAKSQTTTKKTTTNKSAKKPTAKKTTAKKPVTKRK